MKPKFITAKGRVEVERDVLFIKTVKFYWTETAFVQWVLALLPVGIFFMNLAVDDRPSRNVRLILWGFMSLASILKLYDLLFKKSYASRIRLNRIVSFEIKPDMNGLETHMILHLQSGRQRTITFRTLEKQHDAFTEFLSQHIAQPQLA